MLLESVLKTIKEDNLLEETRKAGDVLLKGLKEAQDKFPGLVHSARGIGTYCAINADTSARYDSCYVHEIQANINLKSCPRTGATPS